MNGEAVEEPEVSAALHDHLVSQGATIHTGATATGAGHDGDKVWLDIDVDGTTTRLEADQLLMATGRRARTDHLGLDAAGVDTDQRGHVLGQQFQGSFSPPPLADLLARVWDESVRNLGALALVAAAGAIAGLVRHPRLTALSLLALLCGGFLISGPTMSSWRFSEPVHWTYSTVLSEVADWTNSGSSLKWMGAETQAFQKPVILSNATPFPAPTNGMTAALEEAVILSSSSPFSAPTNGMTAALEEAVILSEAEGSPVESSIAPAAAVSVLLKSTGDLSTRRTRSR